MSRDVLKRLPMRGAAWARLKRAANGSLGAARIADKVDDHDVRTLAVALVYARTEQPWLRRKAAEAIESAIGTERDGDTLALARNLFAYVVAADLIDLRRYDAAFDGRFRAWLREVRVAELEGRTLVGTHEERPNNWGTHAGASRAVVAAYLGDKRELARSAAVFKGWLGDRSAYAGFDYGNRSWQFNPKEPVGVNPAGATIDGYSVDGVLPDDQRRSGRFEWPPDRENYVWEALQGAVAQAQVLYRQGYPVWSWQDRAILRAVQWLHQSAGYPADGDDTWLPWLVNTVYRTSFPTRPPVLTGKNMAWTDWTHGGGTGPKPVVAEARQRPRDDGPRMGAWVTAMLVASAVVALIVLDAVGRRRKRPRGRAAAAI